jgi:hypothetical protein
MESQVKRIAIRLSGVLLLSCAAPVTWFAHYFVDNTLGKCVASGARNRVSEGAFEVSSGAIVCLRTSQTDSGVDSE